MNSNFDLLSDWQEVEIFIKNNIPENYDELFIAKNKNTENEIYIFHDEFDLIEFMKSNITTDNPCEGIEDELQDWSYVIATTKKEIENFPNIYKEPRLAFHDNDNIYFNKLILEVEYTFDLSTTY